MLHNIIDSSQWAMWKKWKIPSLIKSLSIIIIIIIIIWQLSYWQYHWQLVYYYY